MLKWRVNSYILSVCLLISEYVRQQEQDARQTHTNEDSVVSLSDPPIAAVSRAPIISRRSFNALARFLTLEIQYPKRNITTQRYCTTLHSLLRRLDINLHSQSDFELLSWQVVSILTTIDSPDAVWNTIEQITECVTPLEPHFQENVETDDVDSTSSTLVHFLTTCSSIWNNLDKICRERRCSREITRRKRRKKEEKEEKEEEEKNEEDNSSLELLESPAAQHLWRATKVKDDDEMLLSPIQSGSTTPTNNLRVSNLMTLANSKLDSQVLVEKLLVVEAAQEETDPTVWSNDQLNYILSDMIRQIEIGRSCQERGSQRTEDLSTQDQIRLLHRKMDQSNSNVLFVRYLCFLSDRDYQGALDSLHQYHDVLSPRQGDCLSGNAGSDGNSSTSRSAGSAGLHFQGSGIQYAALNLAGLQIVFDHCNAAQESIQEAIRVAQHHGDHICVAFALAWMIRINLKIGASKDDVLQLVGSCLDRAKELRLPALQVLATLTEVESDLMRYNTTRPEAVGTVSQLVSHIFAAHAPAPRPIHIWSRLYATMQSIASISTPPSSFSNNSTRAMNALQAQVSAGSDSCGRFSGSGMDWVKSTEAILDTVWNLSGKVTLSTAAGWGLFGQRSLEKVYNRMHLLCYEDSASTGEIVQTVSRMAISNLAQTDKGEVVYVRALKFLVGLCEDESGAEKRRYLLDDMTFQRTLHYLFFLWALQRGEFMRGEVHLNAILVLSPQGKDFPSYLEALMLKANLWTSVDDYTRSLELLESLESTCAELGFAHLHAQVLIAISRTRFQAAAPHAPFASLNVLLKSVDICRRHHYDLLLAEAHVVMAEIYIAMGKLQDAYSLLNDQMPLVMEHGTVGLRGECLLVLGKTMVASIKRLEEGANGPSSAAKNAIVTLRASAEMFMLNSAAASQLHSAHGEKKQQRFFLKRSSQLKRAAFLTVEPFFNLETPETIRRVIAHRLSEC
ncbi:unnamed protein product [Peronospora farinosa]|uniref:Anaphase-promoting complex subunit 5 n=1 Tax=Peronospora farinosa TaxID=134698 RepID=A0ABN8CBG6_9STRA|nr:unnamed protein product [Peronospora farinosa]